MILSEKTAVFHGYLACEQEEGKEREEEKGSLQEWPKISIFKFL